MSDIVFGVLIAFLLICLVILFCVILVKIYISKIKKYNTILYQKEINQQREINQTIIETQENTLNTLAGELHDDAGQQLTYINMQLENLMLTKPHFQEDIMEISASVSDLDTSIKNLSYSIRSQKIKHYNIIESIQKELEKINRLNVMQCTILVDEHFTYLFSLNERIVLFRIFQETLNNALKYSKARTFSITIKYTNTVRVTFEDDGIGFSLGEALSKETTGVKNIRNRAGLINYSCEIISGEHKGTKIILSKQLK